MPGAATPLSGRQQMLQVPRAGGVVFRGLLLLGIAGASLVSCAKPPPPKVAVQPPRPKPPPPPPPAPPKPAVVHTTVAASWSFQSGAACTATLSGAGLSLDISVTRAQLVLGARSSGKTAVLGHGPVPIALAGTSGNWTVTGRAADRHHVSASQTLTDDAAGQVLVLLEGGVVHFAGAASAWPRLRVPNGGPDGKAWFECVRHRLAS